MTLVSEVRWTPRMEASWQPHGPDRERRRSRVPWSILDALARADARADAPAHTPGEDSDAAETSFRPDRAPQLCDRPIRDQSTGGHRAARHVWRRPGPPRRGRARCESLAFPRAR